ncbi:L,D-transpeptidase family protein [Chryseobacterium gleum]|uniref:L,D-transpeptidase family protein n=1 Tax=Chryseobacterium gleum TaxID=250 RepID=UPI0028AF8622|nr:L,D-transpeptidase family protein [Chryseobacterium gleum]
MKTLLNWIVIVFSVAMLHGQDVNAVSQIALVLNSKDDLPELHFPKSVKQFYGQHGFEYVWINPSVKRNLLQDAVLLLKDTGKRGLSSKDYHEQSLTPEILNTVADQTKYTDSKENAVTDILMTDALITYINYLHFGKYNPFYSPSFIDGNDVEGFKASEILYQALQKDDLPKVAFDVQPKIQEYADFQDYLNTIYSNGTENREAEIKKIAINMERLRWMGISSDAYLLVNIPSYSLDFVQKDKTLHYKVIVGKPSTPSPVLKSRVDYFTTAPDWKVPQNIFIKEMLPKIVKNSQYLEDHHYSLYDRSGKTIPVTSANLRQVYRNPYQYSIRQSSGCDNALGAVVFRFSNSYGVYLHDTSQKQLFEKTQRALSHGCIRVENAGDLAAQLLKHDGTEDEIPLMKSLMDRYERKDFVLKQPVPIMITYLTCLVKNGKVVFYNDIYNLDLVLENKFNFNN